jgi:hypothetical protein
MHFSTKKIDPFFPIGGYFFIENTIKILKNRENLQKNIKNCDFYQKYQKNSKKMQKIRNFSKI